MNRKIKKLAQKVNQKKKLYFESNKPKLIHRLFAGIVPRVSWIFMGGFIFFGVYEKSKSFLL